MKRKHDLLRGFALGIATTLLMSFLVVPGLAASVSRTITVYTGITLYYDGTKVEPKDANGNTVEPLLYNGTTYLPVRAVSNLFAKDINWDGSTRSVYIGDMPGSHTYLGVDLEAYSNTYDYSVPATFKMDGKTYANGFTFGFGGGYAIFNLDGQYNTLEFDVGHTGYVSEDKEILVYLDGSLARTISLKAENMVTHISIPLHGALQLKVSSSWYVGLANAELS